MYDDDTTKQDLIRDIEATARWRMQRAAESEEPERETRAAEALQRAAVELEALPADEARLESLAQFYTEASDKAVTSYLDQQRRILSRYAFDAAEATADQLLDQLMESARTCQGGAA